MKKYTIKDNLGNKKTVYADNLSHAIKLNDADYLGLVKINGRTMYVKHQKSVVGPEWWGITPDKWGDNPKKKFKSRAELDKYLESVGAISGSKNSEFWGDSSLNDSTYELYLGSNLDSDDWAQIRRTIKRYGLYVGEYRKGMETITVHGDRKNIEKLLEYFGHHKGYSKEYNKIKDSIRDEASLATTINALVNDEKAAIDAYNVAIKNLEGSIDDTARQVLINVRDDERRHIENLYSILNGQVTEKNLEDSIHDAVKSPSAYVNTRLVKNMLPNDLMAEGLKNDYSFNDVLKNFDAISSQILDAVKDALDEAKRDIIDFKRNYINALIN